MICNRRPIVSVIKGSPWQPDRSVLARSVPVEADQRKDEM